MSVKVVHTGSGEIKVTAETTPAIKVTSPDVDVVNINPVYRSAEPGPTGPQGPQGPAGSDRCQVCLLEARMVSLS